MSEVRATYQATAITMEAGTDERLVALSLLGRPLNTQVACRLDDGRFLASVGRPLRQVTLGDLQDYADPRRLQAIRALSAIKGLFAFTHGPVEIRCTVKKQ